MLECFFNQTSSDREFFQYKSLYNQHTLNCTWPHTSFHQLCYLKDVQAVIWGYWKVHGRYLYPACGKHNKFSLIHLVHRGKDHLWCVAVYLYSLLSCFLVVVMSVSVCLFGDNIVKVLEKCLKYLPSWWLESKLRWRFVWVQ